MGISGNAALYTGLLIGSVGLLITFLGLGSRGFKTLEVKLLGPGLVGLGSLVVMFRIVILISAKKDKHMKKETENPQKAEEPATLKMRKIIVNQLAMHIESF